MWLSFLFLAIAATGAVLANNNGEYGLPLTNCILLSSLGVGLKPPMGWNTWCTLGRSVSTLYGRQ